MMNISLKPRKPGEKSDRVYMPLVTNITTPMRKDWKKVKCPQCGAYCWESDFARQVINEGAKATCSMCALKEGRSCR